MTCTKIDLNAVLVQLVVRDLLGVSLGSSATRLSMSFITESSSFIRTFCFSYEYINLRHQLNSNAEVIMQPHQSMSHFTPLSHACTLFFSLDKRLKRRPSGSWDVVIRFVILESGGMIH